MLVSRAALLAFAACWPFAGGAQLVVPADQPLPAVANPADTVPEPSGGTNCNNTIADIGTRAVLRAIDSCPDEFLDSGPQYAIYLKQALLGVSVPGATAAAGGLAAEKAAENAFFCISEALIDSTAASASDKQYLKVLLGEAKENFDRATLVQDFAKLRAGLIEKGAAAYLADGEVQTFLYTLDANLLERYGGVQNSIEAGDVGAARFDTPERGAQRLRDQGEALARDCRIDQANAVLEQALAKYLERYSELRGEVAKAKHARFCLDVSANRQRGGGPLASDSPFLLNSQRELDADIAEAERVRAEYRNVIGEFANYRASVQRRSGDNAILKERANRQLEIARSAAADCNWAAADSALAQVNVEALACAAPLDAERQARIQLAAMIEQQKQQLAQLEVEQEKIVNTPFSEVGSCGDFSLVADNLDAIQGGCRALANIESKVAALRNRASRCAEFKGAQLVQGNGGGAVPAGTLIGQATVSPPKVEDFGEAGSITSTYADTYSTYVRIDNRAQARATITWAYNGVPATLIPGQAVTITVTGGVISESPPDAASGLPLSGVVAIYGDVTVKTAQQADRGHPTGQYEFIVNDNAQNVEIHLGGAPAGTGTIWKYTK